MKGYQSMPTEFQKATCKRYYLQVAFSSNS